MSELRQALLKDVEAEPPYDFGTLSSKVQPGYGSRRLPALAKLLEANQQTRGATQLYLTEFISKSMRQVGAHQCLYRTFTERAAQIPEAVLQAFPEHTRQAWDGLVRRAKAKPVCVPKGDPLLFAHGLTIDGELVRYLCEEPEKPKETPDQVFRRLAAKHHPDKGGNPEVMAAVNEMRKAMR